MSVFYNQILRDDIQQLYESQSTETAETETINPENRFEDYHLQEDFIDFGEIMTRKQ